MQIHIPPKSSRESGGGGPKSEDVNLPFILDDVIADGTTLETLPADPSKQPLTFEIQKLDLAIFKGITGTLSSDGQYR